MEALEVQIARLQETVTHMSDTLDDMKDDIKELQSMWSGLGWKVALGLGGGGGGVGALLATILGG